MSSSYVESFFGGRARLLTRGVRLGPRSRSTIVCGRAYEGAGARVCGQGIRDIALLARE